MRDRIAQNGSAAALERNPTVALSASAFQAVTCKQFLSIGLLSVVGCRGHHWHQDSGCQEGLALTPGELAPGDPPRAYRRLSSDDLQGGLSSRHGLIASRYRMLA